MPGVIDREKTFAVALFICLLGDKQVLGLAATAGRGTTGDGRKLCGQTLNCRI